MTPKRTAAVGYAHPAVPWNGLTVTDLFCGAGGSSSGLVEAGYKVVIAANHWALAIESHQVNHPDTDHSQADISQVNPAYFPKTHVLWGSPECTNLYRCPECWQVIEPGWLAAESIIDWSLPAPRIGDRAKPLAEKTRERIRRGIERHWKPFVAAAAGNTYDGVTTGSQYLRAWPVDQALPLQTGTAEHGLAVPPLVVTNNHANRARTVEETLPTATTGNAHALLVNLVSGADESRSRPVSEVLPSIVAGGTHASLLIPVEGRDGKSAASAMDPLRTQSTRNETGLLIPLRNHGVAKPTSDPIDTVSAEGNHHALVMRNNLGGAEMSTPVTEPLRTLTTGGHQSLLDPSETISLDVDDAGFRMLEPHEIQLGMGFAADYLLLGTKRDKVKQAGNAVTPPAARDLGHAVAEFLLAVAA